MPSAEQFQSMTASVFQSPNEETIIAKQAVLADYGREVRAAISLLPPDVSKSLLQEYKEPQPQLFAQIEDAIMSRELSIESSGQGANLDEEWLRGANTRRMSEIGLSADDDWNTPEA